LYRTGRSGSKRDSAGGNVLAGAAPSSVAGAAAGAAGGVIFGNVGLPQQVQLVVRWAVSPVTGIVPPNCAACMFFVVNEFRKYSGRT